MNTRKLLSPVLAFSLAAVSPGLAPYQAAAQTVLRPAPAVPAAPGALPVGLGAPGAAAATFAAPLSPLGALDLGPLAPLPSPAPAEGRASSPVERRPSAQALRRARNSAAAAPAALAPVALPRSESRGLPSSVDGLRARSLPSRASAPLGAKAELDGRWDASAPRPELAAAPEGPALPAAARTAARPRLVAVREGLGRALDSMRLSKDGARWGAAAGIGAVMGLLVQGLGHGPEGAAFQVFRGAFIFGSVLGSIILHEIGHAWLAERSGDVSARMAGQFTWKPWRFMTPGLATFMLASSVLLKVPFVVFFTVMQIGLFKPENKGTMAKVALAGPAVNFILTGALAALVLGVKLLSPELAATAWLGGALRLTLFAAYINFMLGVFNLAPLGPLDGQKVLRAAFPKKWVGIFDRITIPLGLIALLALMFYPVFFGRGAGAPVGGTGLPAPGLLAQLGDPFMAVMVGLGFLIWVMAMLPWVRGKLAKAREERRQEEVVAAGGYRVGLLREGLGGMVPRAKEFSETVAVRWSGADSPPLGVYRLLGRPAALQAKDRPALKLDDGTYVVIDDALLAELDAGRRVLLQDETVQGRLALLDAEALGGVERARGLVAARAAARTLRGDDSGRRLLTRPQVAVAKRLSRDLGTPVYELESVPAGWTGFRAETDRGPVHFVSPAWLESAVQGGEPAYQEGLRSLRQGPVPPASPGSRGLQAAPNGRDGPRLSRASAGVLLAPLLPGGAAFLGLDAAWLGATVLGRSVGTWLLAAGIGLTSLLLAKLVRWVARKILAKSSKDKVLKEFLIAASGYATYLLGLAGIAATLGMTLPTLLSSLGLTTLALTLALQAPISNIAGGIYLLASEPFSVGERIRVTAWDGLEGTVKEVSLTQTTLQGEDGRVVVVPNSRFVTDAIHKLDAGKEAFAPARRTAPARRSPRWYAWLAAAALPAAYLIVRFWLGDAARWLAVLAVAGGAWLAARAVRKAVELALRRSSKGPMFRSILVTLSGFGVYAAAAFVIAHMLGVSLPGLLGGLGVTSIAVGFALRGFLENIVGGLHVLQAGLFSMGDHLQAGVWESLRGHVEDITLTHTRLRTDDRAILVPNSRFLDGGVIRYPEGWVPPPPKDAPAPPGPGPR